MTTTLTLQDLIKLIYDHDIPELEQMKAQGVDFGILDSHDKNSLLMAYSGYGYAERYTQREMVEFLISCGLDVNHQNNGRGGNGSALLNAVANRHMEIATVLLENGANIDIRNSNGNTPLWTAVMGFCNNPGELEMIAFLIANGSSLDAKNSRGHSPRDLILQRGEGIDQGWNNRDKDLRFLLQE